MQVFKYERAKQLIDEKGLKRRWVADQIGLVHSSLNQYLIGKRRPGPKRVEKLAALLGVSLDELLVEPNRKARTA